MSPTKVKEMSPTKDFKFFFLLKDQTANNKKQRWHCTLSHYQLEFGVVTYFMKKGAFSCGKRWRLPRDLKHIWENEICKFSYNTRGYNMNVKWGVLSFLIHTAHIKILENGFVFWLLEPPPEAMGHQDMNILYWISIAYFVKHLLEMRLW